MLFCCRSNTHEIEVVIANGSTENVFCRVNSDRTFVKNQTGGGGLNVAGVAGFEANLGVEFEHRVGGGDGYATISPGNRMTFDSTGKPAYLTIISETGNKVCLDHQVNRGRNFIVSTAFHLKESSKSNIWTDIDGTDYGVEVQALVQDDSQSYMAPHLYKSEVVRPNVDAVDLFNGMKSVPERSVETHIMIANGSNEIIYCRFDVLNGRSSSYETKHNNIAHTPIQPHLHLSFEATGDHHAMTIISKSNVHICVNHIVLAGNGFIINESNFLKQSSKGEIWKDTDGIDHKNADPQTSVRNDDVSFNPLILFPNAKHSETKVQRGDSHLSSRTWNGSMECHFLKKTVDGEI